MVVLFVGAFLVVGTVLLVSGIRGSHWLIKETAPRPWYLSNTLADVRRRFGKAGLRVYAIAVGIQVMTGALFGIYDSWK
jgi:hypothetical protein